MAATISSPVVNEKIVSLTRIGDNKFKNYYSIRDNYIVELVYLLVCYKT